MRLRNIWPRFECSRNTWGGREGAARGIPRNSLTDDLLSLSLKQPPLENHSYFEFLGKFDQNLEPKSEFSWELQFEKVCAQQPCTIFLFIGKLFNQKTQYHPVDEKAFPNKLHSLKEKLNALKNKHFENYKKKKSYLRFSKKNKYHQKLVVFWKLQKRKNGIYSTQGWKFFEKRMS